MIAIFSWGLRDYFEPWMMLVLLLIPLAVTGAVLLALWIANKLD
jgi:hypothetical protein